MSGFYRTMLCKHGISYCKTKPLTFACPLFRKFCKLNKTSKLEGANIDTIPALIGIVPLSYWNCVI